MSKNSRIELPDGTIIEISPNMDPDQISAIIHALRSTMKILPKQITGQKKGEAQNFTDDIDPIQMWQNGSKKVKLALFIRNAFNNTVWLTANQIRDEQIIRVKKLILGETPQIHTYLKRLSEEGHLLRSKQYNKVRYKMTQEFLNYFPEIPITILTELMENAVRDQ